MDKPELCPEIEIYVKWKHDDELIKMPPLWKEEMVQAVLNWDCAHLLWTSEMKAEFSSEQMEMIDWAGPGAQREFFFIDRDKAYQMLHPLIHLKFWKKLFSSMPIEAFRMAREFASLHHGRTDQLAAFLSFINFCSQNDLRATNQKLNRKKRQTFQAKRDVLFPKLVERDGPKCKYCGSVDNLAIDHIVPIVKGGHPTDLSNLVIACQSCNSQKGVRLCISRRETGNGKTPDD